MESTKIIIYDCGKKPIIKVLDLTEYSKSIGDNGVEYYSPYKIAKYLLNREQNTDFVQLYKLSHFHNAVIALDEDGRMRGLPANRYFNDGGHKIKLAGRFIVFPCVLDYDVADYVLLTNQRDEQEIDKFVTRIVSSNYGDGSDESFRLSQADSDNTKGDFQIAGFNSFEDLLDILGK
jgi:hypothetical protein